MPPPSTKDPHFEEIRIPHASHIANWACAKMERSTPFSLLELPELHESGVYALEYRGDFPLYAPLAAAARSGEFAPIYIGKVAPGESLHDRVCTHLATVSLAENLDPADFTARLIIMRDDNANFSEAVERLIYTRYQPVWNMTLTGFGQSLGGKKPAKRPKWDMLHPGRTTLGEPRPLDALIEAARKCIRRMRGK